MYPSLGQPNFSRYQPQLFHVPYLAHNSNLHHQEHLSHFITNLQQDRRNIKVVTIGENEEVIQGIKIQVNPTRKMFQHIAKPELNKNHAYNRLGKDQQRDFSPIRRLRRSPLHHTRNSHRMSGKSNDSQLESDTDRRFSNSCRGSKKEEKIENKVKTISILHPKNNRL